jgi:hypothetical protein
MNTQSMNDLQSVRVFISSTFQDLSSERDLFARRGAPALEKRCRELGLDIVIVDLRWGISAQEARERQTLLRCLTAVESCKPFFVGILGQRYGWLPPKEEKEEAAKVFPWLPTEGERSITELEILQALQLAGSAEITPFFYLIEPDETRPNDEGASDPMNKLRDRLKKTAHPVREGLRSPEELVEAITADLLGKIEEVFAQNNAPDPDDPESARGSFLRFMARSYRDRVLPKSVFKQLEDCANPSLACMQPLIVLCGEEGSGKSCLLARLALPDLSSPSSFDPSYPVVYHHFEPDEPAGLVWERLARLCHPDDEYLRGRKLLECLAKKPPFVLILDGVDNLQGDDRMLGWVPNPIPDGVRVIIGVRPGPVADHLASMGYHRLEMPCAGRDESMRMFGIWLNEHRRTLDPELLREVVADTPLASRLALQELLLCGSPSELLEVVANLREANDLEAVSNRILNRLKGSPDAGLKYDILRFLSLSGAPLTHSELAGLCGSVEEPVPQSHLFPALLDLAAITREVEGRVFLPYEAMTRVVREECFQQPSEVSKYHAALAEAFICRRASEHSVSHALIHLHRAGLHGRAIEVLSSLDSTLLLEIGAVRVLASLLSISQSTGQRLLDVAGNWMRERFETAENTGDRLGLLFLFRGIEDASGHNLGILGEFEKKISTEDKRMRFIRNPKLIDVDSMMDETFAERIEGLIPEPSSRLYTHTDHGCFLVRNVEFFLFEYLYPGTDDFNSEDCPLTREEVFQGARKLLSEAQRIFDARQAGYEGTGEEGDPEAITYRDAIRKYLALSWELEALMKEHEGDIQGALELLMKSSKQQASWVGPEHESRRGILWEMTLVCEKCGVAEAAVNFAMEGFSLAFPDSSRLDVGRLDAYQWFSKIIWLLVKFGHPGNVADFLDHYPLLSIPEDDDEFEALSCAVLEHYLSLGELSAALLVGDRLLGCVFEGSVLPDSIGNLIIETCRRAAAASDESLSSVEEECLDALAQTWDVDELDLHSAGIVLTTILEHVIAGGSQTDKQG